MASKFILNTSSNLIQDASKINLTDNPLFWPPVISIAINVILVLVTIGMYRTNKRTFSLFYEKPRINVLEAYTKEEMSGVPSKLVRF